MNSYFIDTSIIMYAVGKEHSYKTPCTRIINAIAKEELQAIIDTEVIQEILYRYSHIKQKEKGIKIAKDILLLVPEVLSIKKNDIKLAIEIFDKYPYIKSRDALHTAVMVNNGIKTILSTDKDFDNIDEIKRIDPLNLLDRREYAHCTIPNRKI